MRNRLILLPGWGLGVSPLEPLAAALHGLNEHLRVQIEPLPALGSSDLDEWLDELDATQVQRDRVQALTKESIANAKPLAEQAIAAVD